jgi:hypothetical protein
VSRGRPVGGDSPPHPAPPVATEAFEKLRWRALIERHLFPNSKVPISRQPGQESLGRGHIRGRRGAHLGRGVTRQAFKRLGGPGGGTGRAVADLPPAVGGSHARCRGGGGARCGRRGGRGGDRSGLGGSRGQRGSCIGSGRGRLLRCRRGRRVRRDGGGRCSSGVGGQTALHLLRSILLEQAEDVGQRGGVGGDLSAHPGAAVAGELGEEWGRGGGVGGHPAAHGDVEMGGEALQLLRRRGGAGRRREVRIGNGARGGLGRAAGWHARMVARGWAQDALRQGTARRGVRGRVRSGRRPAATRWVTHGSRGGRTMLNRWKFPTAPPELRPRIRSRPSGCRWS